MWHTVAAAAELSDAVSRFAKLPTPVKETQLATTEKQQDLVAGVRIGNASLEVYGKPAQKSSPRYVILDFDKML